VSVTIADLVAGNNNLTFATGNDLFDVMNIDLILQGAGLRAVRALFLG
jgi:hypothetical protein